MKGRGENGIFLGRLRKIKGEQEVFSGEGLPSEGERAERDIFFKRRASQERGHGKTGCFFRDI